MRGQLICRFCHSRCEHELHSKYVTAIVQDTPLLEIALSGEMGMNPGFCEEPIVSPAGVCKRRRHSLCAPRSRALLKNGCDSHRTRSGNFLMEELRTISFPSRLRP